MSDCKYFFFKIYSRCPKMDIKDSDRKNSIDCNTCIPELSSMDYLIVFIYRKVTFNSEKSFGKTGHWSIAKLLLPVYIIQFLTSEHDIN